MPEMNDLTEDIIIMNMTLSFIHIFDFPISVMFVDLMLK